MLNTFKLYYTFYYYILTWGRIGKSFFSSRICKNFIELYLLFICRHRYIYSFIVFDTAADVAMFVVHRFFDDFSLLYIKYSVSRSPICSWHSRIDNHLHISVLVEYHFVCAYQMQYIIVDPLRNLNTRSVNRTLLLHKQHVCTCFNQYLQS